MLKKLPLICKRGSQSLPPRQTTFGIVLSLFAALQLHAQSRTVSGTVKSSDDNSTLPGVNVLVKGTTTGTITDIDGVYSINANSEDVLVFSYVAI